MSDTELSSLCNPHAEPGTVTARPWRITYDGEPWTAATSRPAMLIIRGAHAADGKCPTDLGAYAEKEDRPPSHVLEYHDLASFARAPMTVACDLCAGRGTVKCSPIRRGSWDGQMTCPDCGGYGEFDNVDWVEILGTAYDRVLVWRYLRHVYADRVLVARGSARLNEPMIISSDNWRIYVMPGRDLELAHESFPLGLLEAA